MIKGGYYEGEIAWMGLKVPKVGFFKFLIADKLRNIATFVPNVGTFFIKTQNHCDVMHPSLGNFTACQSYDVPTSWREDWQ